MVGRIRDASVDSAQPGSEHLEAEYSTRTTVCQYADVCTMGVSGRRLEWEVYIAHKVGNVLQPKLKMDARPRAGEFFHHNQFGPVWKSDLEVCPGAE